MNISKISDVPQLVKEAGVFRACDLATYGIPQGDYSATLHAIENLVHSAEAELGQRGSVGIGTPGSISKATGLLKNSNSAHLNGKPVLQDLESLL